MTTNKLSTKRRHNNRKLLLIIVAAILVAGGTTFAIVSAISGANSDDNSSDTSESSDDQNKFVSDEPPAENTEKDTNKDRFNEVPQYEGEDPNNLEELTGAITYSSVNGDNFSVRISIDQLLNSGSCNITMTSGSATYSADAPIFMSGSNSSSCEGFDIPLSELSASKSWNIAIKLTSGDKTGTIKGEAKL